MKVLALALLAALIAQPLAAQSYQCRIPGSVTVPQVKRDGPVRRMPVTGYTLALSWSPEFCRTREFAPAHRRQCSGRAGRFGFIVHGLWPESGRSWPQYCASAAPGADAIRPNLCMTPSARLLTHEWLKHGSCMTRRPETYFRVTRILYNSLRLPDFDRLSRKPGLTAGDVREWFLAANRGWRAEAIGGKLNERGWLQELRLCYSKRFRPEPCDARRRGADDAAPVEIWRGL